MTEATGTRPEPIVLGVRWLDDGYTEVAVEAAGLAATSELPAVGWPGQAGATKHQLDLVPREVHSFTANGGRRLESDDDMAAVGGHVAHLLLPGEIREYVVTALVAEGRRQAVVIDLHDDRLAAVPWELARLRVGLEDLVLGRDGV